MRVSLRQEWTCRFEPATNSVIGALRMTPRSFDGQQVVAWRVDLSADCKLRSFEDTFGNVVHGFEALGPVETLTIEAQGEVDLYDTTGFVRGALERFPEELFLRESPLALSDPALRTFVDEAVKGGEGPLGRMHALMGAIHEAVAFDPELAAQAGAPQAFEEKKASARDLAHLFVAGARHVEIPARYVSGIALDAPQTPAGHAWAEAWFADYGWIAFDPSLNLCPAGRHVRIAMGLDALHADPLRQSRQGYGQDGVASSTRFEIGAYGGQQ